MIFDLAHYLEAQCQLINASLDDCLGTIPYSGRLVEAMRYSLMAGGKRLRPLLCMAGCEAVGGRAEDTLTVACALEMIHTYSLIHDDLPAMDDDALRRGKPTCHKQFDEATAILAGDALLTLAFQLLCDKAIKDETHAVQWLTVMQRISSAAGCRGMVEGQMRDIDAENVSLTQSELEALHGLKTGALIQASLVSGALLGGGNQEQIHALNEYARHIGLAFQVKDDVLNVEGDPVLLGKAVGSDTVHQKSTYPSLVGMEASSELASTLIDKALQALASFDDRSNPLRALATYVIERKH